MGKRRTVFIIVGLLLCMIINPLTVFGKMNAEEIQQTPTVKTFKESDQIGQEILASYRKKQIKIMASGTPFNIKNRKIMVKLKDGKSFDGESLGIKKTTVPKSLQKRNIIVVKVPSDKDFSEILAKLQKDPNVLDAEPVYTKKLKELPQDPYMREQWYLNKIHMPEAWALGFGQSSVVVAVLDSGVNPNIPDLQGRILKGYDFVNNDNDPNDDNGHGTMVASIIAANANNIGGVGLNWKVQILPVKVADQNGMVDEEDLINGIYYAIDHGADIINMSLGGPEASSLEEDALWEAYNKGLVSVASAGNDSSSTPNYPASYDTVMSVSALDQNDRLASFSNYGNWIDLAAPGVNILAVDKDDHYVLDDGTSFSAPMVTGIAAMIKSHHPDWLPNQIEWAIEKGTDKLGTIEWNDKNGYGRLNAYKAVLNSKPDMTSDVPDDPSHAVELENGVPLSQKVNAPLDMDFYTFHVTATAKITIDLQNVSSTLDLVGYILKDDGGNLTEIGVMDNGARGVNESFTFNADAGTYYVGVFDDYSHWSAQSYQIKVLMQSVTPEINQNGFSDVTNHWAKDEIMYLVNQNIITGYSDGTFRPDKNITRAEAAVMIAKQLKLPVTDSDFTDVSKHHWAYSYIGAVAHAGIMNGYGDGSFQPDHSLKREEMAAILVRAYHLSGEKAPMFTDVGTNNWAYHEILKLRANDITNGYSDGTFHPAQPISRAEFSVMMARILNVQFRP